MKTFLFSCLLVLGRFAAAAQDPIEVPGTQQSLVTKLTATWCPFCGGSAWDSYKNMVASHGANAVVFAAHTSTVSKLYSPMAVQLLNNFDLVYSQPYFFYNTKVVGTGGSSTENTVTTNVNNAAKNTPIVQTGMKLTFDDNSRELTVQSRSQFFQYTTGEYFLAFYLLEKPSSKNRLPVPPAKPIPTCSAHPCSRRFSASPWLPEPSCRARFRVASLPMACLPI
ncbi:MAG: hypothetical protein IPN20_13045 [Haliscomenobacter sp.]|nr:hypothetical protein [Haliscomenobacter sp.]